MSDLFGWMSWLTGFGVIGFIALYLLAKPAFDTLWVLLQGAAEGAVALSHELWEGFKDMADNRASLVFCAFLFLSGFFTSWYTSSPKTITVKEKCGVTKTAPKSDPVFTNPLDWFNR